MTNLTVSVEFKNSAAPVTGLTLADIDLYLTAVDRVTGASTIVWDGTQTPTAEIDNMGAYIRTYSSADLTTYYYLAYGHYTGGATVDSAYTEVGSAGLVEADARQIEGADATDQINAQVVDALAVDAYAEPSGVPAASTTLAAKLSYLYAALINQVTVTSGKKTFHNDSDTALWKKDLSDDATTYTETKANSP